MVLSKTFSSPSRKATETISDGKRLDDDVRNRGEIRLSIGGFDAMGGHGYGIHGTGGTIHIPGIEESLEKVDANSGGEGRAA